MVGDIMKLRNVQQNTTIRETSGSVWRVPPLCTLMVNMLLLTVWLERQYSHWIWMISTVCVDLNMLSPTVSSRGLTEERSTLQLLDLPSQQQKNLLTATP